MPGKDNRRPHGVHRKGRTASLTDCLGPDCPQFKGIFMRNLGTLTRALPASESQPYAEFLRRNADSIWQRDRADAEGKVFFGVYWQGPFGFSNATVQTSALDALVETMPLDGAP